MANAARSIQLSIRFTDFEAGFLTWYAKHIDTDRANAIRHVLGSFLADHDQLTERYLQDTFVETNTEKVSENLTEDAEIA